MTRRPAPMRGASRYGSRMRARPRHHPHHSGAGGEAEGNKVAEPPFQRFARADGIAGVPQVLSAHPVDEGFCAPAGREVREHQTRRCRHGRRQQRDRANRPPRSPRDTCRCAIATVAATAHVATCGLTRAAVPNSRPAVSIRMSEAAR